MKARLLVGRNLRRLRVARGLSQEGLGLAAGCEPSYVGRIERGRENVGVDLLELLATSLETQLVELFAPVDPGSAAPNLRPGRKRKPREAAERDKASGVTTGSGADDAV